MDINKLNKKNTPTRWKIIGKNLVENKPKELAKLHPNYRTALEKAAGFAGDIELGAGNQPGVSSEPDPVIPSPVAVTSFTITGAPAGDLVVDDTANLGVNVLPVNADDKSVTYTSSDEAVITVTPVIGLVTAIAAGTATITVTANDGSGVVETLEITVVE